MIKCCHEIRRNKENRAINQKAGYDLSPSCNRWSAIACVFKQKAAFTQHIQIYFLYTCKLHVSMIKLANGYSNALFGYSIHDETKAPSKKKPLIVPEKGGGSVPLSLLFEWTVLYYDVFIKLNRINNQL